jgi:hypothetical protein
MSGQRLNSFAAVSDNQIEMMEQEKQHYVKWRIIIYLNGYSSGIHYEDALRRTGT